MWLMPEGPICTLFPSMHQLAATQIQAVSQHHYHLMGRK